MGYLWGWVGFRNCFGVYSCSWTTYIFYSSSNSDFWFWLNFGVVFYFWGPNWLFFWSGYVSITVLWSIYVVDQLLFCIVSSILTFDFHLIWGSFLTFLGPYWAIFGVRVGFKNCFVVYICRWPTFIFYSFFNSDFWFSLDFGSFFYFFGALLGYFWGRGRFQKPLWRLLI